MFRTRDPVSGRTHDGPLGWIHCDIKIQVGDDGLLRPGMTVMIHGVSAVTSSPAVLVRPGTLLIHAG
ncbi:MAG: hypothetical protein R2811_14700 [Flavobacteriales bacterium]